MAMGRMEYTTVHKLFLQAIANRSVLSFPQAERIVAALIEKYLVTGEENQPVPKLKEIVGAINDRISKYDQKIKFINHELIGEEFLVFCNTAESAIHKAQTVCTEADREYFRKLLELMVTNEDFCIRPIVALNAVEGFSKSHAEKLVEKWIVQGYFFEKDEYFYFGPKTVGDFSNYLKTNYPDHVQNCDLCKVPLFWGIRCDSCHSLLHRACIQKYLVKMCKCPTCKKDWKTPLE